MTQLVGLLNGTNKNYDTQLTALAKALLSSSCVVRGVGGGLAVSATEVASGEAFISCTRTNGEKVMVHYKNSEAVSIVGTGTKKVFVKVDQAKLDDGSGNALDGSGIASIQTDTVYPSDNYVALASIASSTITDARIYFDEATKLPFDIFGVSNHGDDTYTITPTVPVTTLKVGQSICFLADVTNVGASSVAIVGYNSGTPIPIKKRFNVATADGDIPAGAIFMGKFDGTNVQMLGMVATAPSVSIGTLTEYTDPDGDEWDIVEKPDGSQFKVRGATRRGMSKPPALGAISAGSPVYITCAGTPQTISSLIRNSYINIGYNSSDFKAGQGITIPLGAKSLSSIDLYLFKTGSPNGNLTVKIYASDKTTLLATSSSVAESTVPGGGTGSLVTFNFANEFIMEGDSVYIVLETDRSVSSSNYISCDYSSASGTYTSGLAYTIDNSNVYTSLGGSSDLKFSLVFGSVGGFIGKATNQSGFSGILKKATSVLNDIGNIQTTGNAKISSLGNETDTVSSTADISHATQNDTNAITVYSGQSERAHGFFTGPNVGNLSSWSVYISQTGTGGGILTANIYAVSSTGDNMVKTGSSLGSAVISSPTSGVNTFTPASPITLEPNTWYMIVYTSASGNVSNYWGLASLNTGVANLYTDGARCRYYTGTWAGNGAPYLITYYTSRRNYTKGDFIYLSPTPGTFETYRKYKPFPIGKIIDSTNILLEKYDGNTYLGSSEIPINSTYPRGHLPIPKNCTRIRVEVLVTGGTPNYTYLDLRITDFNDVDKSYSLYSGGALSFTLGLGKNYIRAYANNTGTLKVYFYQ